MAFRLLRVHGYHVLSGEVAQYENEEFVEKQGNIDVVVVIELYRTAQERIHEEEDTTLDKLLAWTTTFLSQSLLTNSIADQKLHKQVEYYLNNYHGISDMVGVRRNLDLYDISYYPTLRAFPSLCNEDILAFSRQEFSEYQAQNQKELEQLQRWYADCRFGTLNLGRDALNGAHFATSAFIGDIENSDVRLAFAKCMVLIGRMDDYFEYSGSRQELHNILELVKGWKDKASAEEYGSEEVEILFTALYNTVNELAEMAQIQQGRRVKEFLVELWVDFLSVELELWSDETKELSLDEYLRSSWVSIGSKVCILTSMQFLGVKLSQEMFESEECIDLCWHGSMVVRLLNDVGGYERECMEKTVNSMSIVLASAKKDGIAMTEEEAVAKLKQMAEYHRRKLMQIVYKRETIFPRKCKDLFLKQCKIGYYFYWSGDDEFTSPHQMKEDMTLIYRPLAAHPTQDA